MNAYLFVFDRDSHIDYKTLHVGIKRDPLIRTWSHYQLSSYILISSHTARQLSDSIRTYLPNHKFLIMQVHPNNYSGWLAQDAWDWIRQNIT